MNHNLSSHSPTWTILNSKPEHNWCIGPSIDVGYSGWCPPHKPSTCPWVKPPGNNRIALDRGSWQSRLLDWWYLGQDGWHLWNCAKPNQTGQNQNNQTDKIRLCTTNANHLLSPKCSIRLDLQEIKDFTLQPDQEGTRRRFRKVEAHPMWGFRPFPPTKSGQDGWKPNLGWRWLLMEVLDLQSPEDIIPTPLVGATWDKPLALLQIFHCFCLFSSRGSCR